MRSSPALRAVLAELVLGGVAEALVAGVDVVDVDAEDLAQQGGTAVGAVVALDLLAGGIVGLGEGVGEVAPAAP